MKLTRISIRIAVLFFVLTNCTVKQVRSRSDFETVLQDFKRVTVAVDPESKLGKGETAMAKSMAEQELAHHKEFIVYPDPSNSNLKCEAKIGKSQGVLRLKLEESTEPSASYILFWLAPAAFGPPQHGIKLRAQAQIQKCDTKEILWEGLASSSYSLSGEEDQSLKQVYESKFGKGPGSKAVSYYYILKSLLDKIESPILSEAEQDEKIEVESGF